MVLWVAFVTGLDLSMDAVAASISSSTSARRVGWRQAVKMAAFFGLFQAFMPALDGRHTKRPIDFSKSRGNSTSDTESWCAVHLGYACGVAFRGWFESLDHWVAFILLGLIGAKMICESRREHEDAAVGDPFGTPKLLLLSVATSLDALAVGVSFSLLGVSLPVTIAVIGSVTFLLCLPAVWIGKRLGTVMARRAEMVGGLVLIGIGCKILIEHLSA